LDFVLLIILATAEESQQPQPQPQTEEEEESYQPLYTNSYDLCADILEDIQSLKHVSEKANRVIDVILLSDGLKNGTFLMLLELKIELLQHFLENGI
jgi:hypothetical protein